jgi:hypothetical protein
VFLESSVFCMFSQTQTSISSFKKMSLVIIWKSEKVIWTSILVILWASHHKQVLRPFKIEKINFGSGNFHFYQNRDERRWEEIVEVGVIGLRHFL